MPSSAPLVSSNVAERLRAIGASLRERRKALGLNATETAESAGMSRVTLFRIEKGEASVTMGAYFAVVDALGLSMGVSDPSAPALPKLPRQIRVASYPQLKRLAWQLKATKSLTPEEALSLYERNWRHVDPKAMTPRESRLIESLLAAFGRERLLV